MHLFNPIHNILFLTNPFSSQNSFTSSGDGISCRNLARLYQCRHANVARIRLRREKDVASICIRKSDLRIDGVVYFRNCIAKQLANTKRNFPRVKMHE